VYQFDNKLKCNSPPFNL